MLNEDKAFNTTSTTAFEVMLLALLGLLFALVRRQHQGLVSHVPFHETEQVVINVPRLSFGFLGCRCRRLRAFIDSSHWRASLRGRAMGGTPFLEITIVRVFQLLLRVFGRIDIFLVLGLLESTGTTRNAIAEHPVHGSAGLIVTVSLVTLDHALYIQSGEVVGSKLSFLDDHIIQHPFLVGLAQDIGFDGVLGHEAVDVDVSRLPDAVATVLTLLVHRGIPVQVVEDDGVRTRKIDTETTRSTRQDEGQNARIAIESLGQHLPLLDLRSPIKTQVTVSVDVEELFQDVEHFGHLGEDQGSMTAGFEVAQQLVQTL